LPLHPPPSPPFPYTTLFRSSPTVIVSCGVRAASPLSAATAERIRAAPSGRRMLSAALRTESSRATGTRVARSVRSAPREPHAAAVAASKPMQTWLMVQRAEPIQTIKERSQRGRGRVKPSLENRLRPPRLIRRREDHHDPRFATLLRQCDAVRVGRARARPTR